MKPLPPQTDFTIRLSLKLVDYQTIYDHNQFNPVIQSKKHQNQIHKMEMVLDILKPIQLTFLAVRYSKGKQRQYYPATALYLLFDYDVYETGSYYNTFLSLFSTYSAFLVDLQSDLLKFDPNAEYRRESRW